LKTILNPELPLPSVKYNCYLLSEEGIYWAAV